MNLPTDYEYSNAPRTRLSQPVPPVRPCRTTTIGVSSGSVRSWAGGVKSSPLVAYAVEQRTARQEASPTQTHIVPPSNVRISFLRGVHVGFITRYRRGKAAVPAHLSYSTLSIFEKSPSTQYAVCR